MAQITAAHDIPATHPSSMDDVVAIVSIYNRDAVDANGGTLHHVTLLRGDSSNTDARGDVIGANVFLRRGKGQMTFNFGRGQTNISKTKHGALDVYLPGTGVGQWQFVLVPVPSSNCWRLQSQSETMAIVNSVPIQKYTFRTKKGKSILPQAVYLDQTSVNRVTINGLQIDIRILESVQDIPRSNEYIPELLEAQTQYVSHRSEEWARNRYILTQNQISANSSRVIERFTGEVYTAKLFRTTRGDAERGRNQEFLAFNRLVVDKSIVRYLETAIVNDVPAIITDFHNGFAPYGTLRDNIRRFHPGARCAIASRLVCRLSSALTFLHFHGIIHGHVNPESVLLRLHGQKIEEVLLVNYTTARSLIPNAPVPMDEIVADARAAIEIVENCCDLWALRNAPTTDATGERVMEQRTQKAMASYQAVKRASSDYFEHQGMSIESEKGKKLTKLLYQKLNGWHRAQNDQAYNAALREIGAMSRTKVENMAREWNSAQPLPEIVERCWMAISLGHPWLDNLINLLFQNEGKNWNVTPSEICAKIKELGGQFEEPWQTFEIQKTTYIRGRDEDYDEDSIFTWLAAWCEANPEWREILQTESNRHLQPQRGSIKRSALESFRDAIQGSLPAPLISSLNLLTQAEGVQYQLEDNGNRAYQLEESHQVRYHVPSRMFNLTQVQRLASPEIIVNVVNNNTLHCQNFVEVRGEPKIQGHYVPLTLLPTFVRELGLKLPRLPDLKPAMPTFDPSDFSQIKQGLIVLARTGLLGYASITRKGYQCNFLEPKLTSTFETAHGFIPTYFGDMKVIPEVPESVFTLERCEHWSEFKTAEEIEAGMNRNKRKILPAKRQPQKAAGELRLRGGSSQKIMTNREIDESTLANTLKEREDLRSAIRPPIKRNINAFSSQPLVPSPKRSRAQPEGNRLSARGRPDITESFVDRALAQMTTAATSKRNALSQKQPAGAITAAPTTSFMQPNSALFLKAPRESYANQSFTVVDDAEHLDEDWKLVDDMLARMQDSDDEVEVQGLTAFQYNGSGSDTEDEGEEQSPIFRSKGKAVPPSTPESAVSNTPNLSGSQVPWSQFTNFGAHGVSQQDAEVPVRSIVGSGLTRSGTQARPSSFSGQRNSHLATPKPGRPLATSRTIMQGHRRSTSTMSYDGRSSMEPFRQAVMANPTSLSGCFQSTDLAASSPSIDMSIIEPAPTSSTLAASNNHSGFFDNPNTAINRFFDDQIAMEHDSEDIPDTDVESLDSE